MAAIIAPPLVDAHMVISAVIPVSFAYGAFELKAGDDADMAMARADEAMYAHKRSTR